jgi:hypothetical protein
MTFWISMKNLSFAFCVDWLSFFLFICARSGLWFFWARDLAACSRSVRCAPDSFSACGSRFWPGRFLFADPAREGSVLGQLLCFFELQVRTPGQTVLGCLLLLPLAIWFSGRDFESRAWARSFRSLSFPPVRSAAVRPCHQKIARQRFLLWPLRFGL